MKKLKLESTYEILEGFTKQGTIFKGVKVGDKVKISMPIDEYWLSKASVVVSCRRAGLNHTTTVNRLNASLLNGKKSNFMKKVRL